MDTVELTIYVQEAWQELVIAELADLGFDVFQQEAACVKSYIGARDWNEEKRTLVADWLRARDLAGPLDEQMIQSQNWNARWEETIQPLAVGAFLIKPTWAETPEDHRDKILLKIDPKMSFGTGYHASTRLVLRFLSDLVRTGNHVLDAGSGTGILAIAAVKLGAERVVAFDHDPWAQQNAAENIALNDVAGRITFREGTIAAVPEDGFDLIFANINRNALLSLVPAFAQKVKPGGHVILAGLLTTDRAAVRAAAAEHGFVAVQEASEDEWWSVVLARSR